MIDVLDKERQGLDPGLRSIVDQEPVDRGDLILCASCNHGVTRQSDHIEINGATNHFFTNPYGVEYHVACYAQAPGCAISGNRRPADTWFAGFCWRLASCEACQHHLGWYFDKAEAFYYGLVLDYIKEAE